MTIGEKSNPKSSPSISFNKQALLSPKSPKSQQHSGNFRTSTEGSPSLSPGAPSQRISTVPLSSLPDAKLPPAATATDVEIQHHSEDDTAAAYGIYWRSPFIIIGSFLIGVMACVGHGVYYAYLRGGVVGIVGFQEKNIRSVSLTLYGYIDRILTPELRVSSFFALLAQCLISSLCWFSYYQWLWRAIKDWEISI